MNWLEVASGPVFTDKITRRREYVKQKASLTQANQLLNIFSSASREEIQRLLENSDLLNILRKSTNLNNIDRDEFFALVNPSTRAYSIDVDYRKSLSQMIDVGEFDWVNDKIVEENFPHDPERGEVGVTIELVDFNSIPDSKMILTRLSKRGLRPANLEELCAFGAKFPKVQNRFPIVALGSIYSGPEEEQLIPFLHRTDNERDLDLARFNCLWDRDTRFASVHK